MCFAVLLSSVGWAQSHRGSLGLTVAAGGEYSTLIGATSKQRSETGLRVPLELGVAEPEDERALARLLNPSAHSD